MDAQKALEKTDHNLIADLQYQIVALKKRIQDLELQNARLSANVSNTQNIHEKIESYQVLYNGMSRDGDSNEPYQAENTLDFDFHDSNACVPSKLSREDNDYVTIQGNSTEHALICSSSSMLRMGFEDTVSGVKGTIQGREMSHVSAMEQFNIDNEPLAEPDTVFGHTVANKFLLDHSNGVHDMTDIQDGLCWEKTKNKKTIGCIQSVSHCGRRFVALKVLYFGQRFYGFASEGNREPTVESELFAAMKKTRLLIGDRKEAHYSRCGRTDKGVSAFGQVIALYLRSNCKDLGDDVNANQTLFDNTSDEKEIDYVKVLNKALPSDIRILGWCPAPTNFHARFSCLSREYKYYFLRENLNICEMEVACKKFLGEHDFRNFCKMDALNVHNYNRRITTFEIVPCSERWAGKEIMTMQIKGSAFLWHQVRCMTAVLFMIGRGVESSSVIDELLDTSKTSRKPQYNMASEIPLVLESCEFEGINFRCSPDAARVLHLHMEKQLQTTLLQVAIFYEAVSQLPDSGPRGDTLMLKPCKKKGLHVPLALRQTEPTYEERHMKSSAKSRFLERHTFIQND